MIAIQPPRFDHRSLGPASALAVAAAAAIGAVVAYPMSLLIPAGVAALAVALRRPRWLVLAAALAGSALGQRAEAGLAPPARQAVQAEVELAGDPETRFGRTEVIARLEGRLVLMEADGVAAEVVAVRLAGEKVQVSGRLGPPPTAPWLRVRHVSGALAVAEASPGGQAAPPWRVANRVRRALVTGAEPLGAERRSLFVGLVYGDDRDQSPAAVDDFRGSGLSHLLAVSGQNVALVLAVALPVLSRLPRSGRLAVVGALLALFVLVTRAEPSVLRAVAMAAGAAIATIAARPTPPVQILGLGVAACILVDPLLVRSVGFHLSVAATGGILLLAPYLVGALPGPLELRLPVAVSVAAQMGVAPLLVFTFDGIPVVSLVANLLAAPAAAAVMTWGLPAGLAAGALGPPFDTALHLPTGLALDWLMLVAQKAASLPFGQMTVPHVIALWVALGAVILAEARRRAADEADKQDSGGRASSFGERLLASGPGPAGLRAGAAAIALVCLAQPGLALRQPPPLVRPVTGLEVWRVGGATVVVVEPSTGPSRVLEGLRLAGVARIDILVVGGGASAGDEDRAARHRSAVRSTWWRGRSPPASVTIGGLALRAEGTSVEVSPTVSAASGAPTGGR